MSIKEKGLTKLGFERPTFNDILESKIEKAKELFGEDIDTSEFSVMGKFIRINAYDMAKVYEDLELIYYARFPNTASGVSLDRLCVFAGIKRNSATAAQHTVKILGTAGVTIEAGFIVGTDNEITFKTAENTTIDENGVGKMIVECEILGTTGNVGTNEITEIINPHTDVTEIVSSEILTYGADEESDHELRQRFSTAIEGVGSANSNSIKAAILRVPTVKNVGIIVNDTDAADEKGRPPHSFECFVHGGDSAEYEKQIGEAIFSKKPVGIKAVSTSDNPVSIDVLDEGGHSHNVKFSHTEIINLKITISIKKNNKFNADGVEQIKTNITEYVNNLSVGAEVYFTSLYGYIHAVTGVTEVTNLGISTDGGNTYLTGNITVEEWQIVKTTADDVSVEVVT